MSNVFDNQMPSVPFDQRDEGQNTEQATTEVSEVSTEVTPPEQTGQGEETGVGSWQDEFSSPEEMYQAYANTKKSYDHIRPKLTQTTQELSQLKRNHSAPVQQPQQEAAYVPQQQQNYQQPQQPQQSAEQIVRSFINESTQPIVSQMQDIMLQQEINNVASRHKDFADYGEAITKKFEENPELWNMPNAVENVYKLAKFDNLGSEIGTMVNDAKSKAYADKQIKVLGSDNSARPSDNTLEGNQKTPEQQIAESIRNAAKSKKSIFF